MQESSKHIPNVKKIAVLRANALGDLIFSLPALKALRVAYPDAEIVLLGQRWHHDLLRNRPSPVDRAIVVPRSRGVNGPDYMEELTGEAYLELEEFFQAQQVEHYDLAIQLHGGGKYSNPFIQRLGAHVTVGLRSPGAAVLDRYVPYRYFQPEILRFLEVVSLVGAQPVSLEPHFSVTDTDLQESMQVVPVDDVPMVIIHPGAGDLTRRWPTGKFGAVAESLASNGLNVVVTGTEPERELVEEVIQACVYPIQNLCGRLSMGGLAGLMSRSSLVVSNDSGPLHLAEAVGACTVGIYWCGNLINAEPITRSFHRPVVSWHLDCDECGQNTIYQPCKHKSSFVADIPVEDVLAEAYDLLELPSPVGMPHQ